MPVIGRKLKNTTEELEVDAVPNVAPGVAAPIGSTAVFTSNGVMYTKTGVGDTAWTLMGTGSTNVGVVQKRRTTTYTTTSSFTNITFDTKDVESNATVVHADVSNADRIVISDPGLYRIMFLLNTDDSLTGTINCRALVNNTTPVPGSVIQVSDGDELLHLYAYYTFSANDYVTCQIQNVGGSGTLKVGSLFTVERCVGATGEQGAAGGSTIAVQNDGVAVASNVATLNFAGTNAVATSPSPGVVNVTSGHFGANYNYVTSDSTSTTTSTSYQTKVTLSTGSVPAGTYRVGWYYNFYYTNTGRNFDGRVRLNGSTDIANHLYESSDAATSQRRAHSGFDNIALSAGSHTITLEWRSSNSADTAGILNARLEFWRIS